MKPVWLYCWWRDSGAIRGVRVVIDSPKYAFQYTYVIRKTAEERGCTWIGRAVMVKH